MCFRVQAMQKEREDKLVTTLKNKLEPFVEGQTDEFVNWATAEARRLSTAGNQSHPIRSCVLFFTAPQSMKGKKKKTYFGCCQVLGKQCCTLWVTFTQEKLRKNSERTNVS